MIWTPGRRALVGGRRPVPDSHSLPPTYWVEELRRVIAVRRRRWRRLLIFALIGCATALLLLVSVWKPATLLVWNASASAPIGLYRVIAVGPVRTGDMVIAWTPEPARSLAAERRYLPRNVPLVKRVAATAGAHVCAVGKTISINGGPAVVRLKRDAAGRRMPWWNGCRRLHAREYLLLMDSPRSFDGRYFGVTRGSDLVGRAELLWAKPATGSNDG